MKVWSSTTRLIQLNTYLLHFPPDHSGQLVTSLPDDDIKGMLYQPMPNTWKKKMVEQRYNYLDGPIYSMAEFFKTRIENLENQSHQVFPQETKGKTRKNPRKENWPLLTILIMKIHVRDIQERCFTKTSVFVDIPRINVPLARP